MSRKGGGQTWESLDRNDQWRTTHSFMLRGYINAHPETVWLCDDYNNIQCKIASDQYSDQYIRIIHMIEIQTKLDVIYSCVFTPMYTILIIIHLDFYD